LKFSLGLFENPYVDESLSDQYILSEESRELALKVAHQSMVLLQNKGNLLPLEAGIQRVALIGPLADNSIDLLGCWSSAGRPRDVETILSAFQQILPEDKLTFVQGCSISGEADLDILAAVEAAQNADVIVLALGESRGMTGEAHSRVHLGLPGRQQELVDVLSQTGKPIVAVLLTGRPLVIPQLVEQVDAILVAWHAGIRTGQALADIVFGKVNPSGSLSASWPRAEGQIPVYYCHKPTGRPAAGPGTIQFHDPMRSIYLDEPNTPQFAFGLGLSYSTFEISRLEVQTPIVPLDGALIVSAYVKNVSERVGIEIVQLYVRDLVASVTRPVKELKGFQRIELQPGEEKQVRFNIPASELGFIGLDMKYVVEPGKFKVWIGPDSTVGLEGEFEVTG
jgi:beta-glucosidase